MKVQLTRKGWFGICPVYLGNPYSDGAPLVVERHILLLPLFLFSEIVFDLCFMTMVAAGREP